MRISDRGLQAVVAFEGLKLEAYRCPAGVWTIGVGHTGTVDGEPVGRGMRITDAKAMELLREDVASVERYLSRQPFAKILSQGMFDALVSFIFNVGTGAFETSTMRRCLCTGDFEGAATQFRRWVYGTDPKSGVKIKLPGLVKRREWEAQMYEDL